MTKLFLDMDGVLVDFDRGLEEFNIVNNTRDYLHLPKSKWPKYIVKNDREIIDCMNFPGFFAKLPPMAGYKELLGLHLSPFVLTAWPKTCNDRQRVENEKRGWLRDYTDNTQDRMIYCSREDKQKYAIEINGPYQIGTNLLIDDMESNCDQWERAGGYALLYRPEQHDNVIKDARRILER
jgi:hypothetical protein